VIGVYEENRFSYDIQTMMKVKLLNKVLMEFEVDFRSVFPEMRIPNDQSYIYNLYAFIVHMGNKSESGHYITYAR
jgi:uncharacterized UBP type Zn finger protein